MLRIWLKKHKGQFSVLGITAAMITAFALGWRAGANATDQKAYAALWEAIMELPTPERCALCSESVRYHAPCLLDLSTGQMGEMVAYTPHRSIQGEIAPMEMQETGTFNFQPCAGLLGVRDTCNHTFKVTLPEEQKLMNPALFCRECRQLLAEAGLKGYVIVDLYDLEHIRTYPIQGDMIRDYQITVVNRKDGSVDVCVTGLSEN